MGRRTVEVETPPSGESHAHPESVYQIDANRMIAKLRVRISQLESQVDFLELVLEDKDEQIASMITRVAELEDKKES